MSRSVRALIIFICAVLPTLSGLSAACCGDLAMIQHLGYVCGAPQPRVVTDSSGRLCCSYYRLYPTKTGNPNDRVGRQRCEYVEFDRNGNEVKRWDISSKDISSVAVMARNDQGYVFAGVSRPHLPTILKVYDVNGRIILEDTLLEIGAGSHKTCLTPDGDMLLCEWGRDHLFWRLSTDRRHESYGDANVRETYYGLGSHFVAHPYLVHMPSNSTILLGSHLVDHSKGRANYVDLHNTLFLCTYDIDSSRIVKYREYNLLDDPHIMLTDISFSGRRVFTDSNGITTIYSGYRDRENEYKLYILAVDEDLNPVEMPEKRVERFEDSVDYDRSKPHHDFYYFWAEKSDRIWLHHIISTPDVLYHAEYETLKY